MSVCLFVKYCVMLYVCLCLCGLEWVCGFCCGIWFGFVWLVCVRDLFVVFSVMCNVCVLFVHHV